MLSEKSSRTIFQKMWDGTAPSDDIFKSTEHGFFVTLDGHPASKGHVLVIPEEPVPEWIDLPLARQFQAIALGALVSRHLVEKLQPERVIRLTSGYGVPHYHDHYVPSFNRGDAARVFAPERLTEPMDFAQLTVVRDELEFPASLVDEAETLLAEVAAKYSTE